MTFGGIATVRGCSPIGRANMTTLQPSVIAPGRSLRASCLPTSLRYAPCSGSCARQLLSRPLLQRSRVPQRCRPSKSPIRAAVGTPMQAPVPPPEVLYPVRKEVLAVTPNITLLRASCSARLPEIQFGQRLGTTTNIYLINGTGGAPEVLLDVPSKAYDLDLPAWLKEIDALRTLRYLVITRLNPERLRPLKALLAVAPAGLKLLASNPAVQLLKESAAKDEELAALMEKVALETASRAATLTLSSGAVLRFIPVPTPRWPDLCAAYLPQDEALFSSSFFAAHVALPEGAGAFDAGGWEAFGDPWRYYYDCMLAPAAKQAAVALERLNLNTGDAAAAWGPLAGVLRVLGTTLGIGEAPPPADALSVRILCPIHGPVVRSSLTELTRRYTAWTAEQLEAASAASVAVLYASAYGNTAALAQAISRGITKAGVGVTTLNLEVVGPEEVEKVLENSAGFVIGSPTLGGHMPTQVQTALGSILLSGDAKGLPCGVFGSFGWSGEAVDKMEGRLKDAGFQFAFPAIRCKFKPTESTLQVCEESGTDLAQVIQRNLRRRERVAAAKLSAAESAPSSALAVGRVVGSLCVLTAKEGDAQSAMLASWVSQASFDPPGLTVAVKKDRAVEGLLPIGARFVLNVLAEGKDRPVMKALLKQFAPGEDRFAGLNASPSEASGAMILKDAASYLECSVAQRMDAGDHWIVYATVQEGKVLDESAQSAVHTRKIGTTY